jgi:hypothetical protein
VQVSRYYSFFIVNMVAPIILTTMLGFFVFLLSVEEMEKRLGASLPRHQVLVESVSFMSAVNPSEPDARVAALCHRHAAAVVLLWAAATYACLLTMHRHHSSSERFLLPPAVLLVTLFLALTALQFVVSTNLPNSRCVASPPESVCYLLGAVSAVSALRLELMNHGEPDDGLVLM